jgi:two-component system phosphate regulon response regulator OmpR
MAHIPHILIVDDDQRILQLLKQFLCKNNFMVSTTTSPDEAMKMLSLFVYDLIILDVMMPTITGIEFLAQLKAMDINLPVVMLTALSEIEDKIVGLEAGASDYITKPFEPRELLLRINNLINIHKKHQKEQELVHFGANIYNMRTKILLQNQVEVNLSSTEQALLEILIKADNQVISRESLAEQLGNVHLRSIDVQIVRLRNKIELSPKQPQLLKTIRHKGYVLYI